MNITSREAVEAAATLTAGERVAAAVICPCGTAHRAGSKAASAHAAMFAPKLAPIAPLPTVTADDLKGVLSIWRGAAYVRGQEILVVGQYDTERRLVRDEPLLTQAHVCGLLLESGTPARRLLKGVDYITPTEYESAAELFAAQQRAEAAAMTLAA